MFSPNRTVSHGTMQNADLLQAFASELESNIANRPLSNHSLSHHHTQIAQEAYALIELDNADTESGSDVVNELFDALNYYCDAGYSFGAHEGDGSDYGYWGASDDASGEDY